MPRTYSNRAARAIARCGGQKSRAELPVKTGLEIWERKTQVVGGCARGGTADAPDLGSGPARGGGSTPLARTSFPQEIEGSGASDTALTQQAAEIEGANVKYPKRIKYRGKVLATIYGKCKGRDSYRVAWQVACQSLPV